MRESDFHNRIPNRQDSGIDLILHNTVSTGGAKRENSAGSLYSHSRCLAFRALPLRAERLLVVKMKLGLAFQRQRLKSQFFPCLLSLFFVVISQFALAMVPCLFPLFSFPSILSISALVLLASAAFGRSCRQVLHISASAPAVVFFNILFIWGVYAALIREGFPSLKDFVVNAEMALLVIGLYSILFGDPGCVLYDDSCSNGLSLSAGSGASSHSEDVERSASDAFFEQPTGTPSLKRVRYCRNCKAYIRGFDHHCPAFGNCIGQKNHRLFLVLLTGFIIAEASYIQCSTQFIAKSWRMHIIGSEGSFSDNLATSTVLFCLLQVLWQVVFLMWHIYCICFNIKTNEWINWQKYPEFQFIVPPEPGYPFPDVRFKNPYDKGVLCNIKEFLQSKE